MSGPTLSARRTTRRVTRRVTLVLDIADAPARPIPFSRTGAMYQPLRLTIDYLAVDDQPWNAQSMVLSGPRLRKDGTESLNDAQERLWRDVPEWVSAAADAHMPGGVS